MELRSYNVCRVYKECVRFRIGNDLGVNSRSLSKREKDIRSMLEQIETDSANTVPFMFANRRKDGETWTPYLQIVEMLVLLGRRIGVVTFEGPLKEETILNFNLEEKK